MPKLLDFLPAHDESGAPLYRIYWIAGKFREADYERPWLEIIVSADGRHCYPITHVRPKSNVGNYFFLEKGHKDFALTNLPLDSWIDVTKTCVFSKTDKLRRNGLLSGELAREFEQWLSKHPSAKRVGKNPPIDVDDEEIFMAPWIYVALKFDAVNPWEVAALETYKSSPRSRRVPTGTCFYDAAKNKVVLPPSGAPGMTWWIRAYMDYAWMNFLDKDTKAAWRGVISKKRNVTAANYLLRSYAWHVEVYRSPEEMTLDSGTRAILSEATMDTFTDPREVSSREVMDFVEENCWSFFYKRHAFYTRHMRGGRR